MLAGVSLWKSVVYIEDELLLALGTATTGLVVPTAAVALLLGAVLDGKDVEPLPDLDEETAPAELETATR